MLITIHLSETIVKKLKKWIATQEDENFASACIYFIELGLDAEEKNDQAGH